MYALLSSTMLLHNYVTMHNEGVYIPFPSCTLQLSSLELNFYLPTLIVFNASYLLRMRAKGSRSDYNIQVNFNKLLHLCSRNNFKEFSKFMLACQVVFHFHASSLDVGDAPASYSLT
jgi:hypothetical protein